MRSIAVALVLLGSLGGCHTSNAPAAVRATIDQIEALGYDCGAGIPDNVPSGLKSWSCSGTVAGNRAGVMVEGNDARLAGITIDINSTDPAVTRAEFRRLAGTVPPMNTQPELMEALSAWTGEQNPMILGKTRVNGLCDATQCIIYIGYLDPPAQPLDSPTAT